MSEIKIDYSYIAGFFDGEGSAMILTVKRKNDIFRFRPVIKIAQKTTPVLYAIQKKMGFGTVIGNQKSYVGKERTACYQLNGHKKILKFIEVIEPFVFLKNKQLLLIGKLINLQYKKNKIYTKSEIEKMVKIRDMVHQLNNKTRTNLELKYSKNEILKYYE